MRTPVRAALSVFALLAPAVASAGLEGTLSSGADAFARALRTPPMAAVSGLADFRAYGDEDRLIDLLDDSDPAIRMEAAKALRRYAQTSNRAERALTDLLERSGEAAAVKKEAIKSLAWAAQHDRVEDLLRDIASGQSGPGLQPIAIKALYVVVGQKNDARRFVKDILDDSSRPLAAREAAAWTLWAGHSDNDVRRDLLDKAADSAVPLSLRVEAAKSLFGVFNTYDVKRALGEIARDRSAPEALREPAILGHLLDNQDTSTKRLLSELAEDRALSQKLRASAIRALGEFNLEIARYFHLSHFQGKFIDPLLDQ